MSAGGEELNVIHMGSLNVFEKQFFFSLKIDYLKGSKNSFLTNCIHFCGSLFSHVEEKPYFFRRDIKRQNYHKRVICEIYIMTHINMVIGSDFHCDWMIMNN